MNLRYKEILIYAAIIFGTSIIYVGLVSLPVDKQDFFRLGTVTSSGTFPAALNNFQDNDIINAGDWNHIEYAIGETGTTSPATLTYQVVNTNANNVTYSGHLTITSASTTDQTITNLWVTSFNPTNSSTTNATLTNFWSTTGTITSASTTNLSVSSFASLPIAGLAYSSSSGATLVGTSTLDILLGGTGATSFTANQPLAYNGSTFVSTSSIGLNFITQSSGSISGWLSSTDWTTFNNKQATVTAGSNLTFTGATIDVDDPFSLTKLTVTNASTTNATLTNFWSTTGTITNASTTYLTI